MLRSTVGEPVESFPRPPDMSFATLRWIDEEVVVEDSLNDDDGRDDQPAAYTQEKEMFGVVGEQHRIDMTEAAARAMADENSFLPARFWLMCEESNPHDSNAVSVHAVAIGRTYHVGFLPRSEVVIYRQSLVAIGRPTVTVEILGCFTQGNTAPHPKARLYLPKDFAAQLASGLAETESNHPAWLRDPTPVSPRQLQGTKAAGFTDDELRKIHCWHAKRRRWFGLPLHCDTALKEMRSNRVPDALASFVVTGDSSESCGLGLAVPTTPQRQRVSDTDQNESAGQRTQKKRPRSSASLSIAAEEKIDLAGALLAREDPRGDEYSSITGFVSLALVRRTSSNGEDVIKVDGFLRFSIEDDRRKKPQVSEVDLEVLPDALVSIRKAIQIVHTQHKSQSRTSVSINLGPKLAVIVRSGEREFWKLQSRRIELYLQTGACQYFVCQTEPFLQSLLKASGRSDGGMLQSVKESLGLLRRSL